MKMSFKEFEKEIKEIIKKKNLEMESCKDPNTKQVLFGNITKYFECWGFIKGIQFVLNKLAKAEKSKNLKFK